MSLKEELEKLIIDKGIFLDASDVISMVQKQSMTNEKYSVVEVYRGEYHQGFKSRDEAVSYVHKRFDDIASGDDELAREDDYEFRTVMVLDEWSSDPLLPGER